MLEAVKLPAGVTNLATSLTDMDVDDFSHDDSRKIIEVVERTDLKLRPSALFVEKNQSRKLAFGFWGLARVCLRCLRCLRLLLL